MSETENNLNRELLIIRKRKKFINIKIFMNQIKKISKSKEKSLQDTVTKNEKKSSLITMSMICLETQKNQLSIIRWNSLYFESEFMTLNDFTKAEILIDSEFDFIYMNSKMTRWLSKTYWMLTASHTVKLLNESYLISHKKLFCFY